MPRAKIKDEDRQRAVRACTYCKSSKIRCDSRLPCGRCIKQGRALACEYVGSSSAPRGKRRSNTLTSTTARSQQPASTPSLQADSPPETSHGDVNDDENTESLARSPEMTSGRMLLSSRGERVFVGEIASLSFLEFLRRTLRHHLGPSRFTEPASRHMMLEVEINERQIEGLADESFYRKQELIQSYLEATSGIFDLYSREELFSYLGQSSSASSQGRISKEDAAGLSLVIAIGAQCKSSDEADKQSAAKYFASGRATAFEGMLSDPSIAMIRLFLLLAFYTLGGCRRNAAFMYLGVAGKAACALGLHRSSEQTRHLSSEERNLRLRVWKSLSILDTIVSSVLGRPSSLPDVQLSKDKKHDFALSTSYDMRNVAFEASYGACSYLGLILRRVSNGNHVDLAFAETFLERLRKWSHELPPTLRQFTANSHGDIQGASSREVLIGNTHVACFYYFAVTLITRPFLISHLMTRFQPKRDGGQDSAEQERVSNLAQVCLDAAIYMAQISKGVMDLGGFFGNMCLLKALVFASGLLLGFSLFGNNESTATTPYEAEAAFYNTLHVLQYFSNASPQARLYHEILTDFADGITKHRQKLAENRRRVTNQYIDQSFTIGHGSSADRYAGGSGDAQRRPSDQTETQSSFAPHITAAGDAQMEAGVNYNGNIGALDASGVGLEAMLQLGDPMNLPLLWDDFGIDWQMFDMAGAY